MGLGNNVEVVNVQVVLVLIIRIFIQTHHGTAASVCAIRHSCHVAPVSDSKYG
jgi:hypothetical protein